MPAIATLLSELRTTKNPTNLVQDLVNSLKEKNAMADETDAEAGLQFLYSLILTKELQPEYKLLGWQIIISILSNENLTKIIQPLQEKQIYQLISLLHDPNFYANYADSSFFQVTILKTISVDTLKKILDFCFTQDDAVAYQIITLAIVQIKNVRDYIKNKIRGFKEDKPYVLFNNIEKSIAHLLPDDWWDNATLETILSQASQNLSNNAADENAKEVLSIVLFDIETSESFIQSLKFEKLYTLLQISIPDKKLTDKLSARIIDIASANTVLTLLTKFLTENKNFKKFDQGWIAIAIKKIIAQVENKEINTEDKKELQKLLGSEENVALFEYIIPKVKVPALYLSKLDLCHPEKFEYIICHNDAKFSVNFPNLTTTQHWESHLQQLALNTQQITHIVPLLIEKCKNKTIEQIDNDALSDCSPFLQALAKKTDFLKLMPSSQCITDEIIKIHLIQDTENYNKSNLIHFLNELISKGYQDENYWTNHFTPIMDPVIQANSCAADAAKFVFTLFIDLLAEKLSKNSSLQEIVWCHQKIFRHYSKLTDIDIVLSLKSLCYQFYLFHLEKQNYTVANEMIAGFFELKLAEDNRKNYNQVFAIRIVMQEFKKGGFAHLNDVQRENVIKFIDKYYQELKESNQPELAKWYKEVACWYSDKKETVTSETWNRDKHYILDTIEYKFKAYSLDLENKELNKDLVEIYNSCCDYSQSLEEFHKRYSELSIRITAEGQWAYDNYCFYHPQYEKFIQQLQTLNNDALFACFKQHRGILLQEHIATRLLKLDDKKERENFLQKLEQVVLHLLKNKASISEPCLLLVATEEYLKTISLSDVCKYLLTNKNYFSSTAFELDRLIKMLKAVYHEDNSRFTLGRLITKNFDNTHIVLDIAITNLYSTKPVNEDKRKIITKFLCQSWANSKNFQEQYFLIRTAIRLSNRTDVKLIVENTNIKKAVSYLHSQLDNQEVFNPEVEKKYDETFTL